MSVADTFPLLDQNEPVQQEITAIRECELTDPANAVATPTIFVPSGWKAMHQQPPDAAVPLD
jgi:hypothetical protein